MKKILVLVAILSFTNIYGAFSCTATISNVLVYANGSVNVKHTGRGKYTIICNLKKERQGVSIPTCAMWTSMLQNIQKNDDKAIFYYSGNGTCSELPIYSSTPAPVYIGTVP